MGSTGRYEYGFHILGDLKIVRIKRPAARSAVEAHPTGGQGQSDFFTRGSHYDIMISNYEGSAMAQFVVRNIAGSIKEQLQRRARRHGRSMEEEVREILRNAVMEENVPAGGLGTEISTLFSRAGLTADIAELRGHEIKPATFEE